MLNNTPVEDYMEVKAYLEAMIEHYKHTSSPVLAERRKTYKDVKIAIFGEDIDDGDTREESTRSWLR